MQSPVLYRLKPKRKISPSVRLTTRTTTSLTISVVGIITDVIIAVILKTLAGCLAIVLIVFGINVLSQVDFDVVILDLLRRTLNNGLKLSHVRRRIQFVPARWAVWLVRI